MLQTTAVSEREEERKENRSRDKLVERDLVALLAGSRHAVRDRPAQAVRHPPRHHPEGGDREGEEHEEKSL